MFFILSLLIGCLLLPVVPLQAVAAPLLPVDAFSQLPRFYQVKISPDGQHIAYLQNRGEFTYLVTTVLKSGKSVGLVKTDNEQFKIIWLRWANNEKIVFSALYPDRRGWTGTNETRLMVVDKEAKSRAKLLIKPIDKPRRVDDHVAQFQDRVIDWLPNDPKHILVSVDFDTAIYPSVYRVNVFKRTRKRVKSSAKPVVYWQTDQQGMVRVGHVFKGRDAVAYTRILDIESGEWHNKWKRKALLDPPFEPLGFGPDPHVLYLRADYDGRSAIYTIDTRHLDKEPVLKASDPRYDILGELIYSPQNHEAVGVYHSEAEGNRIYWDSRYQALEAGLSKAFPDTNNQLVSFSRDERRYILFVSSDTVPGTYFMGDRDARTLEPLLFTYPDLPSEQLSAKQSIDITMRDGLTIEAYLTRPEHIKGAGPAPAIIFPHGGPINRDYDGFDYWTQYFASRGVVVLQPNFRGSSGYGHEFMLKAVNGYGLGMQRDLVDATQWLVEQGIADPERICIVGASYGGYAALTAGFKTPDVFRCGISFAGISDLVAQRDSSRVYLGRSAFKRFYGEDRAQLRENSALYHVEKIKMPILLVHGELDRVINVSQSQKMADLLSSHDKNFRYLELENGSHYLLKQANRSALFEAMEVFLDEHLFSRP